MAEYIFRGCLSSIKTDDMGNAKITFFIPMTEVDKIAELNSEVNKVATLSVKTK